MTLDSYKAYVTIVRYILTQKADELLDTLEGGKQHICTKWSKVIRLAWLLEILECYFLPAKVTASLIAGSATMNAVTTAPSEDFSVYEGRMVTGTGITAGTYVKEVVSVDVLGNMVVTLSQAAAGNTVDETYYFGENFLSIDDMQLVWGAINNIYHTDCSVDFYLD